VPKTLFGLAIANWESTPNPDWPSYQKHGSDSVVLRGNTTGEMATKRRALHHPRRLTRQAISFGALKAEPIEENGTIASETQRDMSEQAQALADEARAGIVAFRENMEALQHNFFLRGFLKNAATVILLNCRSTLSRNSQRAHLARYSTSMPRKCSISLTTQNLRIRELSMRLESFWKRIAFD